MYYGEIRISLNALFFDRFGKGPHHVEILLQFHPEDEQDDPNAGDAAADHNVKTYTIVLEMAPIDLMPHAVYWFLNQVQLGLYNGCSFHRNAGHVVQGGPAPNHLSSPDTHLAKRFIDHGYNSILFQEYNEHFPHVMYTVGYAGRPGGPDFYISTEDNTRIHGPGGQRSYDDVSEADPCFAKVISGHDVVERMHQAAVQPGEYKHMVHNVAIVEMKIIENR